MIKFSRLLQALKRTIPPKINLRLPITMDLLHAFSLRADPSCAIDCCFMAVCTLLIYACRRLGELCFETISQFNPAKHLTLSCISFTGDTMLVVFPTLKNRPFGPPLVCPVPRVHGTSFCAVTWMQHWLSISGLSDPLAPVFQRVSSRSGQPTGQPLLKAMFIKTLQNWVRQADPDAPAEAFTGHSFRIAAATILAMLAGGSIFEIKDIGDWKSDCFFTYIRSTISDKRAAAAKLGNLFSSLMKVPPHLA
jgi:hypothetical protein